MAAATERGIWVCNVPTYCIDDVVDHALALLMDSDRNTSRQDRWIRDRRWDRTGGTARLPREGTHTGIDCLW